MGEKKYNFEDERSLADLLGSLPRVEAPANFDARVRSKIAQGGPSASWLIPSVAAVSMCAVVLAVVAVLYFPGADQQIADASKQENVPVAVAESPNPQFAELRNPQPVSNTSAPDVVAEKKDSPVPRPKTPESRDGSGSYRIAIEEIKDPVVPRGMPVPGATPEIDVRPPGPVIKVSAREVFQLIGLDTEFRANGWHVRKVAESSLAGRSGIRADDVIEAIDDIRVTANTTFENGFNGKTLTVLRNGNRQTISIRSN